jgi:two-component system, LytTR family, response regulator
MLKALIIEDELPARMRLNQLLLPYAHCIETIEEATCGSEAIHRTNEEKPDVIFLDIHLGDMTGFDVMQQLTHQPMIVFTTAYDAYAVKAFEMYCVDYLVKPIESHRFERTMERLLNFKKEAELKIDYKHLVEKMAALHEKPKRTSIVVNLGTKFIIIDYNEISHFKADDKYVQVCTLTGKAYLSDKSLSKLEEELPEHFIRIHRSCIINIAMIQKIGRHFKGRYLIEMKDKGGSSFVTSDTYKKNLKEKLDL